MLIAHDWFFDFRFLFFMPIFCAIVELN